VQQARDDRQNEQWRDDHRQIRTEVLIEDGCTGDATRRAVGAGGYGRRGK
jgi:hypothetical protein